MDVVKTNIEKIGGSVDIQSTIGKGTTVRIRIPLTLAIIKVLVVTSGGERYAIPQISLLELVRLEGNQACKGIVPSALSQSCGWKGKSASHDLMYCSMIDWGLGALEILQTTILLPSKVMSALCVGSQNEYSCS